MRAGILCGWLPMDVGTKTLLGESIMMVPVATAAGRIVARCAMAEI